VWRSVFVQRNWTRQRGLFDGKDVFEIYVSKQFRARYDKVYAALLVRELRRRQEESRKRSQPTGTVSVLSLMIIRSNHDTTLTCMRVLVC